MITSTPGPIRLALNSIGKYKSIKKSKYLSLLPSTISGTTIYRPKVEGVDGDISMVKADVEICVGIDNDGIVYGGNGGCVPVGWILP